MSKKPYNHEITAEAMKDALGDSVGEEHIIQLKGFIEQTGSIEAAKAALDKLDELKDAA